MFTSVSLSLASPLARGVVDLIALATAYRDGVEGLEGAQAYSGDGHEAMGEHDQDGLGVVEGHRQVMAHWDHQRVGAAAEAPFTCGCWGWRGDIVSEVGEAGDRSRRNKSGRFHLKVN